MILASASGSPSDAVLSSPQTPSPSSAGGGSFSWVAGVYAAPRPERTLFQAVASLRAADFTRPLHEQVFPACQAGNLTHTPAN